MSFIDYLSSAVLMLITFATGSSLRFADFENILRRSEPPYLGLFLQMMFLPICAFIIAVIADLSSAEKVGLTIVAICPEDTISNLISYSIRANTVLAVALTSINSLLILVSIPVLSNRAVTALMRGHTEVSLSIPNTVWEVTKIAIIPATSGLLLNRYSPNIAHRIKFPLKIIDTPLLGVAFLIKFFAGEESGESGVSIDEIIRLLLTTSPMHPSSTILGCFMAPKLFRLPGIQSTIISIEVGLQNTVLAIFVAGTLIHSAPMVEPVFAYAMFSSSTTLALMFITIKIRRD